MAKQMLIFKKIKVGSYKSICGRAYVERWFDGIHWVALVDGRFTEIWHKTKRDAIKDANKIMM